MSPKEPEHRYPRRILLETSALVAGYSAGALSTEERAWRRDIHRLVIEAAEKGSVFFYATPSYLELGWRGPAPADVAALEPVTFDTRAMHALARISMKGIAEAGTPKRTVKFDAMIFASALFKVDHIISYDSDFDDLYNAFVAAQAESPARLPERIPKVGRALELLPKQKAFVAPGFEKKPTKPKKK